MKISWAKPYIGRQEWIEVRRCFKSGWLSMGNEVKEFETVMANIVESKYAIAVNSGTAALDIALKLIEVKPDDEIIIPAFAYIATGNAVLYQNATPVFADIDPQTYTISPESVQEKITRKTKAVIVIDYAGQAADYQALTDMLQDKGIFLIEDGAPGLGGRYKGKPLCSIGDISTTSFHMAKLFTSVEGGMVFTDRKQWDRLARIIRFQGEDPKAKYHHPVLGHNYRMTDIHAAIGLAQVKRFKKILKKREALAKFYSNALRGIENIKLPEVMEGNKHAWFLYPILVPQRDRIILRLKQKGIETNVSWPVPIYEQKMFRKYFTKDCPVTKSIIKTVLCLPIYHEMTENEQRYVINNLIEAVARI